jgi:hypothetical protein
MQGAASLISITLPGNTIKRCAQVGFSNRTEPALQFVAICIQQHQHRLSANTELLRDALISQRFPIDINEIHLPPVRIF